MPETTFNAEANRMPSVTVQDQPTNVVALKEPAWRFEQRYALALARGRQQAAALTIVPCPDWWHQH